MVNKEKFISSVKKRMKQNRMSMVYLSERSGISRKRLSKLLNGSLEATPWDAISLSCVLDTPAQLLNIYCSNCAVRRHVLHILADYGVFLPPDETELITEVKRLVQRKLNEIEDMLKAEYPTNSAATMETKMLIAAELSTLADMLTATRDYYKV